MANVPTLLREECKFFWYYEINRAQIVNTAVDEILKTGVRIVGITCDSLQAQLAMMRNLGADLNPTNPNLQIFKEKVTPPMFFIHDMCHAIKLVRNAWHSFKKMKNKAT